jgi:hypothetical protein
MSADVDLFGNAVEGQGGRNKSKSGATNDMGRIESILRTAMEDGFALIGSSRRVYRLVGKDQIEKVPRHVEDAVHQLIAAKWLEEGGTHRYRQGAHSEPGKSVLVPRKSKDAAHRWRALKKPQTRRTRSQSRTRTA